MAGVDDLTGKVAVVTGSTGGLGRATALLFAERGARVMVTGRRQDRGEAVVREIADNGGEARYLAGDFRDGAYCAAVCTEAAKAWGRLDILVNNAAVSWRSTIDTTDEKFWDDLMALNLKAPFLCAQAAIPLMREAGGGTIVNIGSVNTFIGGSELFAYSISKGGLRTFSKNLAGYLAREKIRVNLLNVGWVLTDGEDVLQQSLGRSGEWAEEEGNRRPIGRLMKPEEVARTILFFASDASYPITGSEMVVEQAPVH